MNDTDHKGSNIISNNIPEPLIEDIMHTIRAGCFAGVHLVKRCVNFLFRTLHIQHLIHQGVTKGVTCRRTSSFELIVGCED